MTPRELLAHKATPLHGEPWKGIELCFDLVFEYDDDAIEAEGRLVGKSLYEESDGYRGIWLAALYFDDVPFFIYQEAGRDGCDHQGRFLLDDAVFNLAYHYLLDHRKPDDGDYNRIWSMDEDIPELTEFFGRDLADKLEPIEP
jgi:hypothetical protein